MAATKCCRCSLASPCLTRPRARYARMMHMPTQLAPCIMRNASLCDCLPMQGGAFIEYIWHKEFAVAHDWVGLCSCFLTFAILLFCKGQACSIMPQSACAKRHSCAAVRTHANDASHCSNSRLGCTGSRSCDVVPLLVPQPISKLSHIFCHHFSACLHNESHCVSSSAQTHQPCRLQNIAE